MHAMSVFFGVPAMKPAGICAAEGEQTAIEHQSEGKDMSEGAQQD
jgi:hypothetical protein